MFRLTRSQHLPIGVDVGFNSVKLLQLQVVGDDLRVFAADRQAMPAGTPSDAQTRMAVGVEVARQMLRRGGFRGNRAVVCLPRELIHLKNLRLPLMPANELASAMQFEARNLFPFDTDQAAVRWMVAGEVRQGSEVKQEIIVLAARNAEVETLVEQFHAGGFTLESLDYEPCALYRHADRFYRRAEDEHDVHVLADVGHRRTTVVIGRGHEINFVKSIDMGGQALRDAVARKLDITADEAAALRQRLADTAPSDVDAADGRRRDSVRQAVQDATRGLIEDLGRELALCLRYHSVTFRGQRPAKVRLTGGEAGDPHLLKILNDTLPLPVEVARTVQQVDASAMRPALRRGSMSEWAIAMGLSLKGTTRRFGALDGRPRCAAASGSAVTTAERDDDDDNASSGGGGSGGTPAETTPVAEGDAANRARNQHSPGGNAIAARALRALRAGLTPPGGEGCHA